MNNSKSKIQILDWASIFLIFFILLFLGPSTALSKQNLARCGLLNFVESSPITPDVVQKFTLEKNCHVNEVASVLAITKNPILLNLTDGIETDFVNAKRAVFLLELGGDKEVAISLLSAALVSASELSSEGAQNSRLFVFATLEDLREHLGMPQIDTTMRSVIAAYASENTDSYEAFQEIVPYCALLAMDINSSFKEVSSNSVYQTCQSQSKSGPDRGVKRGHCV